MSGELPWSFLKNFLKLWLDQAARRWPSATVPYIGKNMWVYVIGKFPHMACEMFHIYLAGPGSQTLTFSNSSGVPGGPQVSFTGTISTCLIRNTGTKLRKKIHALFSLFLRKFLEKVTLHHTVYCTNAYTVVSFYFITRELILWRVLFRT